MRGCRVFVRFDSTTIHLLCLIEITLLQIGKTNIHERIGIVWTNSKNFLRLFDAPVGLPGLNQQKRIVVSECVIGRVERSGFCRSFHSSCQIPLRLQGRT